MITTVLPRIRGCRITLRREIGVQLAATVPPRLRRPPGTRIPARPNPAVHDHDRLAPGIRGPNGHDHGQTPRRATRWPVPAEPQCVTPPRAGVPLTLRDHETGPCATHVCGSSVTTCDDDCP